MDLAGLHKSYLDRRDFAIPPGDFTPAEKTLLARFGRWMEALASGALAPLTPAQEQFVRVSRGLAKPAAEFEVAWIKVMQQRAAAPEVVRTFRALAEARAAAAALEAEYRAARSAVLARIQEELAAVDLAYAGRLQASTEAADHNEQELRQLMLRLKHSVRLAGISAAYTAGRVSWDNPGMEAYAQNHPEVLKFRKVGKPVVALRYRDQLVMPDKTSLPVASNDPMAGPASEPEMDQ